MRSRAKRKVKLREGEKKSDVKWKIANIIVRTAYEEGYAIVLGKLGKKPVQSMIDKIKIINN